MRQIQQEENDWTRDQEVLTFYKEGLQSEIATLKEQIASAKTRKEGGDQQSLDKVSERDRLTAAEDELKTQLRVMEEEGRNPLWEATPAEFGLTRDDLNTHSIGNPNAIREQTPTL